MAQCLNSNFIRKYQQCCLNANFLEFISLTTGDISSWKYLEFLTLDNPCLFSQERQVLKTSEKINALCTILVFELELADNTKYYFP